MRIAHNGFAWIEQWLEVEREQLALWVPAALGAGIAGWFVLPGPTDWLACCCGALGLACLALLLPVGARLRHMLVAGGLLACIGCLLVWGKATWLGQPPLARPIFAQVTGTVTAVAKLPAQQMVRVGLRPIAAPALPAAIRVNIAEADVPEGLGKGAVLRFRVRLMPPVPPSVPGAFDFARRAYFQGIGATGRALAPVEVMEQAREGPTLRARLFAHINDQVAGAPAGIAVALATGDQGAIAEADAEAMRRSGLAHLLSISGLHVTALIGAVIFLLLRLLALIPRAALDWPLMLIAAAGGALAGIGYTLLTGAEVPTVRSCIAALLAPIALFHFHKAGLLGAVANLVAIPLTTFVIMPLEALALGFDLVGLGAPFWWLTAKAIALLLAVAHGVAASPMAVMLAPAVPGGLFAVILVGGLWCLLWRSRWRWLGLGSVAVGLIGIALLAPPDIVVTGDGRHVAVRTPAGTMALLREGAGDYVRDVLSESAGYDGTLEAIAKMPQARCSTDLCAVTLPRGGRDWHLLVTRNAMLVDRPVLERDCAAADIVISDRGLPWWCRPRWMKIDRRLLSRTGGLSIGLESGKVHTVHRPGDAHPWIVRPAARRRVSGQFGGR